VIVPSMPPEGRIDAVLRAQEERRAQVRRTVAGAALVLLAALAFSGCFEVSRYRDLPRTLSTLLSEAWPPDFTRWRQWGKPLLETLAMSVAGTGVAALASIPLGALASGRLGPRWSVRLARLVLDTARSIPCLVWGIAFVAAVGFGPLPGMLALACHSTGMLGKFFAEILEHAESSPSEAVASLGVGNVGILRFVLLPQCLPRMVDVVLYRLEHNVREATTVGVVGAGGIGLEIVTAFHLFEYSEALALLILLLVLVAVLDQLGSRLRRRLLGTAT